MTYDELKAAVAAGEIDTVLVCMVDMQGRLIGKRLQAEFFLDSNGETHACNYLLANDMTMEPVPGYGAASWDKGYGDFALRPDLATLKQAAWLEGTALVLCDVLGHGGEGELAHSPRAVLKRQIDRLAERGMTAMLASELEFYLFEEPLRTIHDKGYRDLITSGYYIEDYHILQTTKEEPVMRAIRNGLQASGIAVENTKGEWGPGQAEINVRYTDALTMADNHAVIKNAIKEIAFQKDRAVTFMAKWDYDLAGSSCHVHASLWDKEGTTPLFFDANAPLGMSQTMRHFVAGQVKYAPDVTLLLAPYVNSYKRFQASTFAPTTLAWSNDNRTAGFRLCGEGTPAVRMECRIGGGDLNPYMAFAGLIAAGLAGVEEELTLAPPADGDAYGDGSLPEIPKTLREATTLFAESELMRNALGDEVVAHYAHAARWEQAEYDRRVTDFELFRGFEQS